MRCGLFHWKVGENKACSNKSDQVLLGRLEFPTRALWDDLVPINREVFAKRFVLGEV